MAWATGRRGSEGDLVKHPICSLQHIAISVANLEESIAWYQEMFGFYTVSRVYVEPCHSQIATMENGCVGLELFLHDNTIPLSETRKNPDTDPMEQGVKHFCFATEDLCSLLNELVEKGVKVLVEPVSIGTHTVCYIQDNSGNPIELMQ